MTALGVDCTLNDRIYTWSDIKPKHKTADAITYEMARDLAEEKYHEYTNRVDAWIACGQYDEMNEFLDECKRLEVHAQQLHKQMNCDHENLDEIGQDIFTGGGFIHREHLICRQCGKEFSHAPKGKRVR